MKHLLLASLITLLAFGTACGQASEPAPEPVASNGIQVHGHWSVTVTNPDGTVDAVHEFENAFNEGASTALTALIMGESSIKYWLILFQADGIMSEDTRCLQGTQLGIFWLLPDEVGYSYAGYGPPSVTAIRDLTTEGNPIKVSGYCTLITEGPSEITKVMTNFMLSPPSETGYGSFGFWSGCPYIYRRRVYPDSNRQWSKLEFQCSNQLRVVFLQQVML